MRIAVATAAATKSPAVISPVVCSPATKCFVSLGGPEALEAIARISPPEPIRSLRQDTNAHALRYARTCYNHLAGRLGVAVTTALLERDFLAGGDGEHHPGRALRDRLAAPGRDVRYQRTPTGRQTIDEFGLDLDDIERHRPQCATAWIGPNNAIIWPAR